METYRLPEDRLRNLGVGLVYLFGSQAQGTDTPLSDVDIGVVFTAPEVLANSLDLHTKLYDLLTDVIPGSREVDVVFLQQTSPEFQFHVIRTGQVIFESDPIFRADYEERVVNEYLDFEPVLREFSAALLAR
ncbi:MAG: nucleotidyltransferase domain-containing protein [Nitrospirae bacterium]|nr:nucleotidyltransferase domain-containing protein [Nitrospirota bacterium]